MVGGGSGERRKGRFRASDWVDQQGTLQAASVWCPLRKCGPRVHPACELAAQQRALQRNCRPGRAAAGPGHCTSSLCSGDARVPLEVPSIAERRRSLSSLGTRGTRVVRALVRRYAGSNKRERV